MNSFPLSTYLSSWTSFVSTHSSLPLLQSSNSFGKDINPVRSPDTYLTLTGSLRQACNLVLAPLVSTTAVPSPSMSAIPACFNSHLPVPPAAGKPQPYCIGLKPASSELHPHCLAKIHLQLWHPLSSHSGEVLALSEANLDHIILVINVSWATGTLETYRAGLLVFHTFCDTCNIPDVQQCPTTPLLIIMFIASCDGSFTGSTLPSDIFSIQVWNILHRKPWSMDNNQVKAMLNSGH